MARVFGLWRTRTYASSRNASQTHPLGTAVQSVPSRAEIVAILGALPKSNILEFRPSGTDFKRKPGVERVSPMLNTRPPVRHSPPVVPCRPKHHFGLRSYPSALTEPPKSGLFQIRVKIRVSEQAILPFGPTPPSSAALPQLGRPRFSPISATVPGGRVCTRPSGAREKLFI